MSWPPLDEQTYFNGIVLPLEKDKEDRVKGFSETSVSSFLSYVTETILKFAFVMLKLHVAE
jgi:hypothetical protein